VLHDLAVMKKNMKVFECVALVVAAATWTLASGQTVAGENTAEREIRGWINSWTKAFSAKDVDTVMELYTDDVVAYDVVPPLQYIGKAAYRADYQQFFSQYEDDLHVEVRDLHVGVNGELAYATGLEMISGTLKHGQKKSNTWVRFTSLYRKLNGKWLDFHDHVSVPADIESGKALLDLKP
jgi:uncharacterized protein (TIGR02246 family)